MKIEILIADDHPLMRESLRKILKTEDDMIVTAEATNGKEAVELTRRHSPHVVLMDVNMPEINGIEATRQIISDNSDALIIGISSHESESISAQAMIEAGASSYLAKSDVSQNLCALIRTFI